jgi:hypothetical protein
MQVLTHVENALALAKRVESHARKLEAPDIALRIEEERARVAHDLAAGHAKKSEVQHFADARTHAIERLSRILHDGTAELEHVLGPLDPAVHTGGRALSVVERARFRWRTLLAKDDEERVLTARVEHALSIALDSYDHAVDAYLHATSEALMLHARAVLGSQRLRVLLERARDELLSRTPAKDERARALRSLTLRTRPSRFSRVVDECRTAAP